MATLRKLQKQMTRQLLLDNAIEQFADKGYTATTIDDIAASAGTTRTTFYLHYSSKAEVVREAINEMDAMFTGADDPPLATVIERGDRALIEAWINRKFDQWEEAKPYLQAAYQAAPTDMDVDNALQNWFEETAGAMERGLEAAGRFDRESRRIRCVLAFGEFEFLARRWLRNGWRVEREISLRLLTDSWCHLLTDAADRQP